MATVATNGPRSSNWIVDDKILVEQRGRSIVLIDIANGQVRENVGDMTAGKTRAEYLISSGKFATHLAYMNGAGSTYEHYW